MPAYKINLKEQTATSINGITFKLTETKPGEYEGVCLNLKDITPDDLDDVILGRMIKEAGMFYKMECSNSFFRYLLHPPNITRIVFPLRTPPFKQFLSIANTTTLNKINFA
ncbi:MAG: hypothetical protein HOI48_12485 [Nitrospina sp.]|nr:hypothetical protein [Nitrospina sp.]